MSFEGFHHATPLEDRFFARIGDTDVTPIEVWRQLAEKENAARRDRDGPQPYAHGVRSPKLGKVCARTMDVLRSVQGDMNTEEIANLNGLDNRDASGIMQRLQCFGLVEKIGTAKIKRHNWRNRVNVWRVTEAGEEYRNG